MFFEEPATLGTIVDCSKKAEELDAPCRASLVLSMASWVAAARSKGAPPEQPAIDTQRAPQTNEIGIHRRALTRIGNSLHRAPTRRRRQMSNCRAPSPPHHDGAPADRTAFPVVTVNAAATHPPTIATWVSATRVPVVRAGAARSPVCAC